MAFSPDGNHFAILSKNVDQKLKTEYRAVKIFELGRGPRRVEDLIKDIQDDKFLLIFHESDCIKKTQKIYFDRNNRFLCCYGQADAYVISLNPESREWKLIYHDNDDESNNRI